MKGNPLNPHPLHLVAQGEPRIIEEFPFVIKFIVFHRTLQGTYQNVQPFMRICLPHNILNPLNQIFNKFILRNIGKMTNETKTNAIGNQFLCCVVHCELVIFTLTNYHGLFDLAHWRVRQFVNRHKSHYWAEENPKSY